MHEICTESFPNIWFEDQPKEDRTIKDGRRGRYDQPEWLFFHENGIKGIEIGCRDSVGPDIL